MAKNPVTVLDLLQALSGKPLDMPVYISSEIPRTDFDSGHPLPSSVVVGVSFSIHPSIPYSKDDKTYYQNYRIIDPMPHNIDVGGQPINAFIIVLEDDE